MKTDVNFKAALSQDLYVIRGIAIVLVVVGHVIGYNRDYGMRKAYNSDLSVLGWIGDLINTFHMPLFFIASGIAFAVFSNKDTTYIKFARSKLEKLLIPLICWAPGYFIFQSLYKGESFSLLDVINAVVYPYEIFWFIHSLIFATILSFICFKLFKSPLIYFGISLLLFVICSHYLNNNLIYIWWHWNIFYAFGVIIAPYLNKLHLKLETLPLPITLLISSLCMTVLLTTKYFIKISNNGFDFARLINGPTAFLLLYIILEFSKNLAVNNTESKFRSSLATNIMFIGKISIVVYLFHGYFTRSAIMIINKILGRPEAILYFLVVSLMGVLGPVVLYQLLHNRSKFFRYSIGAGK